MEGKRKGKERTTDTVFVVLYSMCRHYAQTGLDVVRNCGA
jgi:hypothetical protein